jgi:ParB family chromosome partitioning protein
VLRRPIETTSDFGNFELFAAHPLEKAQGFKALLNLEDPKYNIEQIAAKVGKSPAYCAARVRLTELVAPVIEAFYAEEIGVGHALLLAKLQPHSRSRHSPTASARSGTEPEPRPNASCSPRGTCKQWIEHNVLLKQAPLIPAARE